MSSPIIRAAAAVIAVVSLAACTPTQAAPPVPAPSQPACQDAIAEGCREIAVGGRTYRYYVSPPPSRTTGEALLVDLGGPGISLGSVLPPDYGTSFRKDLQQVADGKALLLIEEPWVTGDVDAGCRESSARFYSWARRNWRTLSGAAAPAMNCPWGQGVYGWNRDSYRAVVSAITTQEHLTSLDMAAISFGAVRYAYVDDLIRSATLVRPAAAPGTRSSDVIAARTAQVWKSLVARCAGCTATTVRQVAAKTIQRYQGASVDRPDRSVPFTDFDVVSAFVAAGLSTSDEPNLGWRAGTTTVDPSAAAQLSDALWLRIGEESVSPALVAYTDEYCQAYPGDAAAAGTDPIRRILSAPNICTGHPVPSATTPRPVNCIIIGANDPSAPAALAKTWTVEAAGRTTMSPIRQHWFTDMATCQKGG